MPMYQSEERIPQQQRIMIAAVPGAESTSPKQHRAQSKHKESNRIPQAVGEGPDIAAGNAGQGSVADTAHDAVIAQALKIMESRLQYHDVALNSPRAVSDYLRLRLAEREYEVFCCLFLDAQHRLIACEELFRGTLTQTSVYPREVVKSVLRHNAAAVIFSHNHPSGIAEPSRADELLTTALKSALALIDCRVLDHVIVAGATTMSMAERGLL